jgi:hypothetical protein
MLKKVRAQQITLELPTEGAEVWVRAVIQTVYKDAQYNTTQTVDRTSALHRRFSEFATQIETIQDPITGQSLTISGVGIALAVSAFVKTWMLTDIPGATLNTNDDITLE